MPGPAARSKWLVLLAFFATFALVSTAAASLSTGAARTAGPALKGLRDNSCSIPAVDQPMALRGTVEGAEALRRKLREQPAADAEEEEEYCDSCAQQELAALEIAARRALQRGAEYARHGFAELNRLRGGGRGSKKREPEDDQGSEESNDEDVSEEGDEDEDEDSDEGEEENEDEDEESVLLCACLWALGRAWLSVHSQTHMPSCAVGAALSLPSYHDASVSPFCFF